MRPRISVLMPVYNRAHLVKQAIQSIFDQTFQDYEFIAIDDGSDDNTWQILQECAKLDSRFRPIRRRHEGLVGALNYGNEICQGKIIIKQDSDDLSLPNRLEVINRQIKDSDFFYHGMYQTFEGDGNILQRSYIPALPIEKGRILKEQYIPGCFAYTKEFIMKNPYRKSNCSEDWMLILDAFLKGNKISFVNEGLYEYILRVDSNSMINEGTGAYEDDEKDIRRILKEEYNIDNFKYAIRK